VSTAPLEARLERVDAEVKQTTQQQSTEQEIAREAAASRRFITRTVLSVWAGSLVVWAAGALRQPGAHFQATVTDIIKTAVLPLTTLVLGYYLSRRD
jgi:nitric oxide synthase oxygenase domain/subunit